MKANHEETILQLGGIGRLRAMVGASDFLASDTTLYFRVRGCRAGNKVAIELTDSDTYTVRLWSSRGRRYVAERAGVFCSELRQAVEGMTGLCLSL